MQDCLVAVWKSAGTIFEYGDLFITTQLTLVHRTKMNHALIHVSFMIIEQSLSSKSLSELNSATGPSCIEALKTFKTRRPCTEWSKIKLMACNLASGIVAAVSCVH